ncbi:MAG: HNH endonuclease [Bacteroidales bacterium]|nr:HNH endonuclease [Bacteroidales bacterium]
MDDQIRIAAFKWLDDLSVKFGDTLNRKILEEGFIYQNQRITVIGPKGIWKPKQMSLPLSITTTSNSPYEDSFTNDGFLQYKYRGTDPNHPDNIGLRKLMQKQIPLIYFHSVIKGKYLASWPVFIQNDDTENLTFTIALEDISYIRRETVLDFAAEQDNTYPRRAYLTASIKQRLHQSSFRERVLLAYQNQCTLCKLKHPELLDAAHIIPDSEELGLPIVQNGLSLCKIHHAAYDKNIIGITADYTIKVRNDILRETDGPMLRHGIQSLENKHIILPNNKKNWPDKERLDTRFQRFMDAS